MIRPPERISVAESAKRYVKVRTPNGAVTNWDKAITPYMIEPMNLLTSRLYDAVIFVGPAQSGKTQALITCHMAYIIKCDPSDFLIMQTTKGTARDFDTQVIKRAFRDSPRLKEELASGNKSDNTYDKVFKSGGILFQRWPSINEISGKPLKFVSMTDYDRMTQNIDGEGSPFALAQQRTAKFLSRGMTLVETSPGFDIKDSNYKLKYAHEAPPCGGALSLYNMGDMRRWYVTCPECGEYYMPPHDERAIDFIHDRDLFGATETNITRSASYICTNNGCLIHQKHKKNMNQTGLWVPQGCKIKNNKLEGTPIKSRIASFWFPGVFAAYSNLDKLVEKYLKGHREYDITGSEENLKTIINVGFGSCYMPRHLAELNQGEKLQDRAEDIKRKIVPKQARMLLASIDVQGGKQSRFVVEVHAIGVNIEQWVVDRFDIDYTTRGSEKKRINPGSYIEDWELLIPKVITAKYKTECGKHMAIHKVIIDTGGEGETTHYAYEFIRMLKQIGLSNKLILTKGGSSKKNETPVIKSYGRDKNGNKMRDVPLYILNTNFFKDIVASILRRTAPGAMFMHFANWLNDDYYDELKAETRSDTGKWKKIGSRKNETLDLHCYILALCWILGINKKIFNWDSPPPWARPIADNENASGTEIESALKNKHKPSIYIPD